MGSQSQTFNKSSMRSIAIFLILIPFISGFKLEKSRDIPPVEEPAKLARWIIHNSYWASMGTISAREPTTGYPFSNPWDISDGASPDVSTGIPYMYFTDMEMSVIDLKVDNRLTLSVTLDQGDYCRDQGMDAQDPPCGRVILTGTSIALEKGSVEYEFAKESMFAKHPGMSYWPEDHGFYFAKLNVEYITLLAGFGGVTPVPVEDYFAASLID